MRVFLRFLAIVGCSLPLSASAETITIVTKNVSPRFYQLDTETLQATGNVSVPGFGGFQETIVSMDYRAATGELYVLGDTGQLYSVDPAAGTRTAKGSPIATGSYSGAASINFNPTVDRIRLVSTDDNNLRVHPDTGAIAATDGTLRYADGDPGFGTNPAIVGAAYTNSVAGATSTSLYAIDAERDVLVRQDANAGLLTTVGSLGLDFISGRFNAFDISGETGIAYLIGDNFLGNSSNPMANILYTVDLTTGGITALGEISGLEGFQEVAAIAVAPAAVPEPTTWALAATAAVCGLAVRLRRTMRTKIAS